MKYLLSGVLRVLSQQYDAIEGRPSYRGFMHKMIICLVLFLGCGSIYSQEKAIDSSNIAFKAKLLTLSRIGVADSTSVLGNVLSQKVSFIPNRSENILLLKIKFGQKYFQGNSNRHTGWFGDCNFYLAYNQLTNKFYRLGGFDTVDTNDFFDDLFASPSRLDTYDFLINEDFSPVIYDDIDISCLEGYYKLKPRQKRKRGFTCFRKCSEAIYIQFTTHKGFD